MNVFEIFAKIGLDQTDYEKGLADAESKGSKFGAGLKAGAGVAAGAIAATAAATIAGGKAFVAGVSNLAAYGNEIDKNSQKLNMSRESYQEWSFIMEHAGTSIEGMKMSMKTLANAAETGKDSFERLGISQEQIASMSQEELFGATISALQNVESETERTYLAGQLLGRGATELGPLLNMSAEELENMRQQAHDLGGVLSDETIKDAAQFEDSLQNMQVSFDGMKNSMLANFLPAFSQTMDGLASIFSGSDVEGGLAQVGEGVKNLADQLVSKAPEFLAIGGKILNALLTSITTNLPVLLNAAVPVIMELTNGLISAAPAIIQAAVSLIGTIGQALGDPGNLENLLSSAVEIVLTISNAVSENAETVIPAIVEIIMQMMTALTDESVLMPLLQAGLSVITAVVNGILKAIPVLVKNLPAIIDNIVSFLVNSTPLIIQAAIQLIGGIISAIPEICIELGKSLPQIIDTIVKSLLQGTGQIVSVGVQLIQGLWKGISDMAGWIGDKIKGFGQGVLNGLKTFFGIASPSKVFRDEVGKFLAMGLGEGFDEELPEVLKGMQKEAGEAAEGIASSMTAPFDDLSIKGASFDGYTTNATTGSQAGGSNASLLETVGAYIDARLEKLDLTANIYIAGRKIESQIVTASAHNNMISGGR